jgi:hypothetical protein
MTIFLLWPRKSTSIHIFGYEGEMRQQTVLETQEDNCYSLVSQVLCNMPTIRFSVEFFMLVQTDYNT